MEPDLLNQDGEHGQAETIADMRAIIQKQKQQIDGMKSQLDDLESMINGRTPLTGPAPEGQPGAARNAPGRAAQGP